MRKAFHFANPVRFWGSLNCQRTVESINPRKPRVFAFREPAGVFVSARGSRPLFFGEIRLVFSFDDQLDD